MKPEIKRFSERKIIGLSSMMKQSEHHKIPQLWSQFMPRKKEILNLSNSELIALQDYSGFGNLKQPFNIWACAEVSNFDAIPNGMETTLITEGLYAVFLHKGMNAGATYQRIMTEWLPNSGYMIDDRPHFQVMGEKYKNGSEDSEEDFYVPVKPIL